MIQKPKGTQDLYGSKGFKYKRLCNYIDEFITKYNYEYIKTPTFESSDLFKRGVGVTSDIVTKETYDFIDKGSRNMTLKPEVTAGVVRCIIENKLHKDNTTNKYYYIDNCFRYERPQEGRYREFTQFGVEVLGNNNPAMDAEVISLAYRFITSLNINNIVVKINTLGDSSSRIKYNEVLKEYLTNNSDTLCDTCKERILKNPLRVLDCKIDTNNIVLKDAPKTINYLNEKSNNYFNNVLNYLKKFNIPYIVDTSLVRGLDYYTHTVFEICSKDKLSNIGTLCAGGRYDNLVETIGGPSLPGVGFALGIERLLSFIDDIQDKEIEIFILNMDNNDEVYTLADELRSNNFVVELDYNNRNVKGQYKLIDKYNPRIILIVGEDEIKNNYISIKDNITKDTIKIQREDLIDYLSVNL
ncbi:MAG: histidine--tRNA ligase [Bacilli bacterium]